MTNHLTQDVAPIPFLWIVPLVAYLLSFIICFEARRIYNRILFLPLFAAALAFMMHELWVDQGHASLWRVIEYFAASLFAVCMVCHGELARLKPHPRYLTGFYATVALGGVMGGLFVGLAAPNILRAYYEFPLGLGLTAGVLTLVYLREMPPLAPSLRAPLSASVAIAACAYMACVGHAMNHSRWGAAWRRAIFTANSA